jgi:hypothetical protein
MRQTHEPGPARTAIAVCLLLFCATTPSLGQNLLVNGGFEDNGADWCRFSNAECAEWAKETGSWGAVLQGWVMNGAGGFFQSVKGEPGLTYTLTIRARKEELFSAATVFLRLEFYKADDATKAGHDQGTINIAGKLSTDWQWFTTSGQAPLGTVFVRPVFGFQGATAGDLGKGKQSCLFDNASMKVEP